MNNLAERGTRATSSSFIRENLSRNSRNEPAVRGAPNQYDDGRSIETAIKRMYRSSNRNERGQLSNAEAADVFENGGKPAGRRRKLHRRYREQDYSRVLIT